MFRPLPTLLLTLACVLGLSATRPSAAEPDADRHLALGMPAKATTDKSHKDAYLLKKEFFAVSYNNSKGTPNWVAWNLRKDDFGDAARPKDAFHPDSELPTGFLKVRPTDYIFTATGFERGHMCPNADRDATTERAKATFVMTNMVPQSAELNEKAWGNLEKYCRRLVEKDGMELFIYTGPEGRGGWSDKGYFNTTNGKVIVPAKCWKVIVYLPAGEGNPVERVKGESRVIAVIMPNDCTLTNAWGKWRVKVKDVEELTGYTFFDKVPEAVRKVLIDKLDDVNIPGG
jgi:endonuclease G